MLRLEPADPNITRIELGTIRVSDTYDFEAMGANLKTIPDHKAVWADVNYIHRLKYGLNKNKESKHYMKHDGRIG